MSYSNYKFRLFVALGLIMFLIQSNNLHAQQIAFPGAEGYGRFAEGGRGGDVYVVSNLDNDGEGSLRNGIENQNGPRTIVFAVSGTIELNSEIRIVEPYLIIAGQTAPGDGICIKHYGFKINEVHDIIMRYIRVRLGDQNKGTSSGVDCITADNSSDIIFDHISSGWGIDAIQDTRGTGRFTLQWSIYGETLHNTIHYEGASHSKLGSYRECTDNISVHHNLLHSTFDRHPTLGGGEPDVIMDFRNNLVYNAGGHTNFGSSQNNGINNYYKNGPDTKTSSIDKPMKIKTKTRGEGWPKGFVSGNVFAWSETFTNNNYLAIKYIQDGDGKYLSIPREEWELPNELVFGDDKPITQSAAGAYDLILLNAGASISRDSNDDRIINEVKTGTGRVPDSQDEVGGWPTLNTLPAPTDTDQDGMPDAWEAEKGLDSSNPDDGNEDRDYDGFTNLEEYINSLASFPFDTKPVVNIVSPISGSSYLLSDVITIKAGASDFGEGSIEKVELFLNADTEPFATFDSGTIETTITDITKGTHYIIAKTTDNGGNVALDSVEIYAGSAYYTITIDESDLGSIILNPSGGTYIEGREVSCIANPTVSVFIAIIRNITFGYITCFWLKINIQYTVGVTNIISSQSNI